MIIVSILSNPMKVSYQDTICRWHTNGL